MKNHVPEAVSASDLARILPIGARRIRQLENEGILSREVRTPSVSANP